jgi:hypothetical protein
MSKGKRIPKTGDSVNVVGRDPVFAVYSVDGALQVVDLKELGGDLRLATIPWASITFLDE